MSTSTAPLHEVPTPSPKAPRTRVAVQHLLCDTHGVWYWSTYCTDTGDGSKDRAYGIAVRYAKKLLRQVRLVRVQTGKVLWTSGYGWLK